MKALKKKVKASLLFQIEITSSLFGSEHKGSELPLQQFASLKAEFLELRCVEDAVL